MKVYYLYNILDKFFPILTWNSFIDISPNICLDNDTANSSTLSSLRFSSQERTALLQSTQGKARKKAEWRDSPTMEL